MGLEKAEEVGLKVVENAVVDSWVGVIAFLLKRAVLIESDPAFTLMDSISKDPLFPTAHERGFMGGGKFQTLIEQCKLKHQDRQELPIAQREAVTRMICVFKQSIIETEKARPVQREFASRISSILRVHENQHTCSIEMMLWLLIIEKLFAALAHGSGIERVNSLKGLSQEIDEYYQQIFKDKRPNINIKSKSIMLNNLQKCKKSVLEYVDFETRLTRITPIVDQLQLIERCQYSQLEAVEQIALYTFFPNKSFDAQDSLLETGLSDNQRKALKKLQTTTVGKIFFALKNKRSFDKSIELINTDRVKLKLPPLFVCSNLKDVLDTEVKKLHVSTAGKSVKRLLESTKCWKLDEAVLSAEIEKDLPKEFKTTCEGQYALAMAQLCGLFVSQRQHCDSSAHFTQFVASHGEITFAAEKLLNILIEKQLDVIHALSSESKTKIEAMQQTWSHLSKGQKEDSILSTLTDLKELGKNIGDYSQNIDDALTEIRHKLEKYQSSIYVTDLTKAGISAAVHSILLLNFLKLKQLSPEEYHRLFRICSDVIAMEKRGLKSLLGTQSPQEYWEQERQQLKQEMSEKFLAAKITDVLFTLDPKFETVNKYIKQLNMMEHLIETQEDLQQLSLKDLNEFVCFLFNESKSIASFLDKRELVIQTFLDAKLILVNSSSPGIDTEHSSIEKFIKYQTPISSENFHIKLGQDLEDELKMDIEKKLLAEKDVMEAYLLEDGGVEESKIEDKDASDRTLKRESVELMDDTVPLSTALRWLTFTTEDLKTISWAVRKEAGILPKKLVQTIANDAKNPAKQPLEAYLKTIFSDEIMLLFQNMKDEITDEEARKYYEAFKILSNEQLEQLWFHLANLYFHSKETDRRTEFKLTALKLSDVRITTGDGKDMTIPSLPDKPALLKNNYSKETPFKSPSDYKIVPKPNQNPSPNPLVLLSPREDLGHPLTSYGFTTYRILGDGNCYFRALFDQLNQRCPDKLMALKAQLPQYESRPFDEDNFHEILRSLCVSTLGLMKDDTRFAGFGIDDIAMGNTRALNTDIDGEHHHIAMAMLFGITIVVCPLQREQPYVVFKGGDGPTIYLEYDATGRGHYQSLRGIPIDGFKKQWQSSDQRNFSNEAINFTKVMRTLHRAQPVALPKKKVEAPVVPVSDEQKRKRGETIYHRIIEWFEHQTESEEAFVASITPLIQEKHTAYQGRSIRKPVHTTGVTALHIAAMHGNASIIKALRYSAEYQTDLRDSMGRTPLQYYVYYQFTGSASSYGFDAKVPEKDKVEALLNVLYGRHGQSYQASYQFQKDMMLSAKEFFDFIPEFSIKYNFLGWTVMHFVAYYVDSPMLIDILFNKQPEVFKQQTSKEAGFFCNTKGKTALELADYSYHRYTLKKAPNHQGKSGLKRLFELSGYVLEVHKSLPFAYSVSSRFVMVDDPERALPKLFHFDWNGNKKEIHLPKVKRCLSLLQIMNEERPPIERDRPFHLTLSQLRALKLAEYTSASELDLVTLKTTSSATFFHQPSVEKTKTTMDAILQC